MRLPTYMYTCAYRILLRVLRCIHRCGDLTRCACPVYSMPALVLVSIRVLVNHDPGLGYKILLTVLCFSSFCLYLYVANCSLSCYCFKRSKYVP